MSIDLQGGLRFWVFLLVLVALFWAALFRPERIRQRARLWIAAGLLAFILFLECVAPLFFSPALGTSPSAGGAIKLDSLASGMQDYLKAVKVIGVLQHAALAAAVLFALSAFFDGATISGEHPPRRPEAAAHPRSEEVEQPSPRRQTAEELAAHDAKEADWVQQPPPHRRTAEDACLSCGARISPDASKCPACGWTWGNEVAVSD